FSVSGKPPSVTILTPQAQARVVPGQTITFEGDATDLQDSTLPDDAFVWSYVPSNNPSATPVPLGSGRQFSATLPVGTYDVTLTVVNSIGLAGTSKVTVAVAHSLYLPMVQR